MAEAQGGAAGHGASGKVGARRDQLAIVPFGEGRWHQHQALGLFCHGGANFSISGRAHSSVRAGFGLISCSKEEEQARLRVVP